MQMNMVSDETLSDRQKLLDGMAWLCGGEAILTDAVQLRFHAQDLFTIGVTPIAVVQPATTEEVAQVIRFCRQNAIAIFPRGGGMSYSEAFQPTGPRAIILDTAKMTAIREIALADGHVTVEAGCNWGALDKALAKNNRRARFWGTMSGGVATIGGTISQGGVTFGSGVTGASANTVKSFEIVTGVGAIIRTGSDGTAGTAPFNRNFGPDLTGVFANDAGALGFKTAVTLEIEPRPTKVSGLSFAFNDFTAMSDLFGTVSQARLASEIIAMDAAVARQNAGSPNLMEDMKAMLRIGKAAGNPFAAIGRMAGIALGGRRFIEKAHYTAHFVVEGRDAASLKSRIRAIRAAANAMGGNEIVNTVPLMTRANPFPILPVTHPDGRRMLPIHGIFNFSAATDFHEAYMKLKLDYTSAMQANGVEIAEFFAGVAGVGILYEPVFYWADSLAEYHERMTPDYLDDMPRDHAANPKARQLVEDMMGAIITLMQSNGATHFQIGRTYPYAQRREGGADTMLRALKAQLDPDNIMNPGALGLGLDKKDD